MPKPRRQTKPPRKVDTGPPHRPAQTVAWTSPTPRTQPNRSRSDDPRDRVLQSLAGLIGTTITLTTRTAVSYQAIVGSTASQGNTTGVTLRNVKDLTTPGAPPKDSIFIASTNIESYTPGPAHMKSTDGDTPRNGTDINQKKDSSGHERKPQDLFPGSGVLPTAPNEHTFGVTKSAALDQLAVNENNLGVAGSFNEAEYIDRLDRTAANFKERELKAQRIAAEILGSATNNPRVREERGIDDSGANEEDKYGAVVRGQDAYIPPAARRGAGGALSPPSNAVGANNVAANITPTTAPKQEVPKVSANGPDDTTVAQNQSPPDKTPSPAPGATSAAKDAPAAFRDYVATEKQRLARKRQALVKSEMDKRMAELVKYSQSFKLNKPIPDDLVPILARDEEKQRQIKKKAKEDAELNQARAIRASTTIPAPRGADARVLSNSMKPPTAVGTPKRASLQNPPGAQGPSVGPTFSRLETASKIPMFIQPIPAFEGDKAKQTSSGASTTNIANGNATPAIATITAAGQTPTTSAIVGPSRFNANSLLFRPDPEANVSYEEDSAAPTVTPSYTYPDSPLARNQSRPDKTPSPVTGRGSIENGTTQVDKSAEHLEIQERLHKLTSEIAKSNTSREAFSRALSSEETRDDAQVMFDYLNIILHEADIFSEGKGGKSILDLLCKLANSAEVYPRCYILKGIKKESDPIRGGGFADVHKEAYKGQMICLKVIRMFQGGAERDRILRNCMKEMLLWAHLSHDNVLPFYGVYYLDEAAQRPCLASPWMKNGNLGEYLKVQSDAPRLLLTHDIIEGLLHLHEQSIVHGDLKTENILVSDHGQALIADFGLSKLIMTTTGGVSSGKPAGFTTHWAAPELLAETEHTKKSDIWSFGCLCLEIFTGRTPFHNKSSFQVMLALHRGDKPYQPQEGDNAYNQLDRWIPEMMMRCWEFEPGGRPTCEEIRDILTANINQSDERLKAPVPILDKSTFWEDMRVQSDTQVDYQRVEQIMCHFVSSQFQSTRMQQATQNL